MAVSHRQIGGSADWRQLSREIQQLRVELSQKNLKLESTEADCQRKVAGLEQKLAETLHQKQLLQVCLSVSVCECVCEFTFIQLRGQTRARTWCCKVVGSCNV